jgi:hypothetical protein
LIGDGVFGSVGHESINALFAGISKDRLFGDPNNFAVLTAI